jgi:hypothetical protein
LIAPWLEELERSIAYCAPIYFVSVDERNGACSLHDEKHDAKDQNKDGKDDKRGKL